MSTFDERVQRALSQQIEDIMNLMTDYEPDVESAVAQQLDPLAKEFGECCEQVKKALQHLQETVDKCCKEQEDERKKPKPDTQHGPGSDDTQRHLLEKIYKYLLGDDTKPALPSPDVDPTLPELPPGGGTGANQKSRKIFSSQFLKDIWEVVNVIDDLKEILKMLEKDSVIMGLRDELRRMDFNMSQIMTRLDSMSECCVEVVKGLGQLGADVVNIPYRPFNFRESIEETPDIKQLNEDRFYQDHIQPYAPKDATPSVSYFDTQSAHIPRDLARLTNSVMNSIYPMVNSIDLWVWRLMNMLPKDDGNYFEVQTLLRQIPQISDQLVRVLQITADTLSAASGTRYDVSYLRLYFPDPVSHVITQQYAENNLPNNQMFNRLMSQMQECCSYMRQQFDIIRSRGEP